MNCTCKIKTNRKLTHPGSEVTRLKLLWRDTLPEAERDYWREQFASARSRPKLRQDLQDKFDIKLPYDMQLIRFCRWLEDEDLRKQLAEEADWDRAELEAQGLSGEQLREELLRRMKERALARGDFKLGAEAVKLDLRAEGVTISRQSFALKVRRADTLDRAVKRSEQPGGLTPEVLRQIEKDLNLM